MNKSLGIEDYLGPEHTTKINDIFNKIKGSSEFEFMFFNYKKDKSNYLPMQKYIYVLEYLSQRNKFDKKVSIEKIISLDVVYGDADKLTSYRIVINGIQNINKYVSLIGNRNNHVVFKVLLSKMLNGDKNISILKKVKNFDNIHDFDDLNIRVRMSDELEISKAEIKKLQKINENSRNRIQFRFKQRVSLFLQKDKDIK